MNNQMTRTHIFVAAFFVVFFFLLYEAMRLLAPFSSALLWAGVIALATYPLYRKIRLFLRGRENVASIIMTLLTFVLVIGPTVFLFAALTAQVLDLYREVAHFIQSGKWVELWGRLKTSFLGDVLAHPFFDELDIKGLVMKGLRDISSGMATQLGSALKNTLLVLINFLIMLFSLFFFYRDGESFFNAAIEILPFTDEQKQSITRKLSTTFSAVLNGIFLLALLQGIITGIGFALFGLPFSVFWGFLAFLLALLPVVGAAAVWLPGAIYLFVSGHTLSAVLLGIWGVLLVSVPDNLLKPILIGKQARLPIFFMFIGILGGIKVYGVLGILIGPLVVTLVTVFIKIYRVEYASAKQEVPAESDAQS